MSGPIINLSFDLDEILLEAAPKAATVFLALTGAGSDLGGTSASMVLQIEGKKYAFTAENGVSVSAREGDLSNPTARISLSLADIAPLIIPKNIDMLFMLPENLKRERYEALSKIRGEAVFHLENENGTVSRIAAVFNGASSPKAEFRLSIENARQLFARKNNPVSMFMGGLLKITGDIGFAMTLQPLFT